MKFVFDTLPTTSFTPFTFTVTSEVSFNSFSTVSTAVRKSAFNLTSVTLLPSTVKFVASGV